MDDGRQRRTLRQVRGWTVDHPLADDDADVVIRPTGDGGVMWLLSRRDDPSGRVVVEHRVPAGTTAEPERMTHPGHGWFS